MSISECASERSRDYACPACKGEMQASLELLHCPVCQRDYPLVDDHIPDFLLEEPAQSDNPILRGVSGIDRLAPIYETRLWYPLVLWLYGGRGTPSLERLAVMLGERVDIAGGRILDVACGPGTYGRRLATPGRQVFGIDISLGMLRQGARLAAREGLPNVHFARAQVEVLPFAGARFDAAVCGGSLHLFPDTLIALREIARTLKPGAPLAVMTFVAGDRGILKYARLRRHVEEGHNIHVFRLPQLEEDLAAAGFSRFEPEVYGSLLVFRAQRVPAAT